MEYSKSEAEMILGISSTTFYKLVKNLGIQPINRITDKGKSTFISQADLDKMIQANTKTASHNPNRTPQGKINSQQAEEWEQIKEENFTLRLKSKEQDEIIKSKEQLIALYKDQQQTMQNQRNNAQQEFRGLYDKYVKSTNKATAFIITSFALLILLILLVLLIGFKKLQF